MTAQLSWKRALEDSSPVMVNGTAGPGVEPHQGDLFQQDPFQDDHPKELREDEAPAPAAALVCSEPKEHPDQKEKEDDERQEEEEQEEEEENVPEGSKAAEEQKPKPNALDDLFSSLASSDMYNCVPAFGKLPENVEKVGNKFSSDTH